MQAVNLKKLNPDLLRIYREVALCENMSRASQNLFVTQPAVSRSIALLESQLGVALFERTGRGLHLTAAGKSLLETVETIYDELGRGSMRLSQILNPASGELRVGTTHLVMRHFALDYLAELFRNNGLLQTSNITLKILTENMSDLINSLLEDKLDLCFLTTSYSRKSGKNVLPPSLEFLPLKSFHWVFLASKAEYGALQGKNLSLEQVSTYPLIALKQGTLTRTAFDNAFKRSGLTHNIRIECDMMAMIVGMAAQGLGIGEAVDFVLSGRNSLKEQLFALRTETVSQKRWLGVMFKKQARDKAPLSIFLNFLGSNKAL